MQEETKNKNGKASDAGDSSGRRLEVLALFSRCDYVQSVCKLVEGMAMEIQMAKRARVRSFDGDGGERRCGLRSTRALTKQLGTRRGNGAEFKISGERKCLVAPRKAAGRDLEGYSTVEL